MAKKLKRGPKPKHKKDIKEPVRIYLESWKIKKLGGLQKCQAIAAEAIENKLLG